MTTREPPEDIPRERVQLWLPNGWLALSPDEVDRLVRLLRAYSQETYAEHSTPAIQADVEADRLEERGAE